MKNVTPIATRLGFTHVSVAQVSSGDWFVFLWSEERGPTALPGDGKYISAVKQAEHYADKNADAVLDLPDPEKYRTIDVWRCRSGAINVEQWSRGGDSGAIIRSFGPHEREEALAYALSQIPHYAPCKLGSVEI